MMVGFFVGGYTGVLLAITAVPLWTRNYLLMGPLFLASAMSNATAALALVAALRGAPHSTLRRLERLDGLVLLGELALLLAVRRNLGPVLGRPLATGRLARLFKGGVFGAGIALPLALQAMALGVGGWPARALAIVASGATLAGGFVFRYVIVMAGHASADDPEATFHASR
jgi:formate-dependent nitrite reductase membrane component NrfD